MWASILGLQSSRNSSKHGNSKSRSQHRSRTSSRSVYSDEEHAPQAEELGTDELRRRRTTYYESYESTSPQNRRHTSDAARSATSNTTSERRSPRRKHSSRSSPNSHHSNSERAADDRDRRTEEYVYGARRGLAPIDEDEVSRPREDQDREGSRQTKYRDEDVYPDESVSQIGGRDPPEPMRNGEYVRPSVKRSKTSSSRLSRGSQTSSRGGPTSSSRRSNGPDWVAPPSASRRHSTTSIPSPRPPVQCETCAEEIPYENATHLKCGHNWCNDCLVIIFEMSTKEPDHMPPRCCKPIPVEHVARLFDEKFLHMWRRKLKEFNEAKSLHCSSKECRRWIKQKHIHRERGKQFATCPICKVVTCALCGGPMHKSAHCPKDPGIAKILEQAKDEGWQRCYQCKTMVEKNEGCNHMTCRCGAEFCIICGVKWKECGCPWFPPERGQVMDSHYAPSRSSWHMRQPVDLVGVPNL